MELGFKHIAPYMPYRLNCHCRGLVIDEYSDNPIPVKVEIVTLSINYVEIHEIGRTVTEEYFYKDIFPIVRPRSDLSKEIEHNGERFVPIEWFEEKYYTLDLHKQCERLLEEDGYNWIYQCNYMLVQQLLEWHFDVFNLIPEVGAIDINTLKI